MVEITTFNTYLEYHESSVNKHKWYRVTIESCISDGSEVHAVYISYGRIGARGTPKHKGNFDVFAKAHSFANSLVLKKTKGRDAYGVQSSVSFDESLQKIKSTLKGQIATKAVIEIKNEIKSNKGKEQTAIIISTQANQISIGYLKGDNLKPLPNEVANPLNVDIDLFDAVSLIEKAGSLVVTSNLGHYSNINPSITKPCF
mgnify:CR=1 FL=1